MSCRDVHNGRAPVDPLTIGVTSPYINLTFENVNVLALLPVTSTFDINSVRYCDPQTRHVKIVMQPQRSPPGFYVTTPDNSIVVFPRCPFSRR